MAAQKRLIVRSKRLQHAIGMEKMRDCEWDFQRSLPKRREMAEKMADRCWLSLPAWPSAS